MDEGIAKFLAFGEFQPGDGRVATDTPNQRSAPGLIVHKDDCNRIGGQETGARRASGTCGPEERGIAFFSVVAESVHGSKLLGDTVAVIALWLGSGQTRQNIRQSPGRTAMAASLVVVLF